MTIFDAIATGKPFCHPDDPGIFIGVDNKHVVRLKGADDLDWIRRNVEIISMPAADLYWMARLSNDWVLA
jgi:hypothetical protein